VGFVTVDRAQVGSWIKDLTVGEKNSRVAQPGREDGERQSRDLSGAAARDGDGELEASGSQGTHPIQAASLLM
jgi:hypothetical protein